MRKGIMFANIELYNAFKIRINKKLRKLYKGNTLTYSSMLQSKIDKTVVFELEDVSNDVNNMLFLELTLAEKKRIVILDENYI